MLVQILFTGLWQSDAAFDVDERDQPKVQISLRFYGKTRLCRDDRSIFSSERAGEWICWQKCCSVQSEFERRGAHSVSVHASKTQPKLFLFLF